jgi:hypothetical protein
MIYKVRTANHGFYIDHFISHYIESKSNLYIFNCPYLFPFTPGCEMHSSKIVSNKKNDNHYTLVFSFSFLFVCLLQFPDEREEGTTKKIKNNLKKKKLIVLFISI